MTQLDYIKDTLSLSMPPVRFQHSLGVAETAKKLAYKYGADPEKAWLAGILHDIARDLSDGEMLAKAKEANLQVSEYGFAMPLLLHGPVGAIMAREQFQVNDPEIINAIALHTVGSEYMSLLDKILFVADKIEPNRRFSDVEEIRKQADTDLDLALVSCFDQGIKYTLKLRALLHPTSVKARNAILAAKGTFRK